MGVSVTLLWKKSQRMSSGGRAVSGSGGGVEVVDIFKFHTAASWQRCWRRIAENCVRE